jgi:hypothetical protein
MGEQITAAKKRKTKRRSRAQVEADRRLAALRKNLAVEIEADISRFSGEGQSPVAGFLVLTRVRILLAFLQAFFPLLIKAPKPRRIPKKKTSKSRKRRGGAKPRKKANARAPRAAKIKVPMQAVDVAKSQGPSPDILAHTKEVGIDRSGVTKGRRVTKSAGGGGVNRAAAAPAIESIKIVKIGAGAFN